MGPDGVEACSVDMARIVFTLVYINTVHVAGRAVVTGPAGAFVRPVDVLAVFIHSTRIVQFLALVYILAKSPVNQNETWITNAREGTLVVDTCSFVSASSIIHQTLIDIIALDRPVPRITRPTGAVIGARQVNAKGIGVALLSLQAFIHIHTGEAVSPVPCFTLAREGARQIRAGCVRAAAACHTLVQVMALGVIEDEAGATVAVV